MSHPELERLCATADDFYRRGDAFGGTGNLSVRLEDGIYVTPTGHALKGLAPDRLAPIDLDGRPLGDGRPSKEYPFHLAIYRARPDVRAVVHLHAPHAVAVSCLADLDEREPLPPITPYFVMRVAPLGVVPYHRPGSDGLAAAVGEAIRDRDSLLLRNHGHLTVGATFAEAADRAFELEETCRLFFLLQGHPVRHLTGDEVEELQRTFAKKAPAPSPS